jgi:hypothetical protein
MLQIVTQKASVIKNGYNHSYNAKDKSQPVKGWLMLKSFKILLVRKAGLEPASLFGASS